MDNDPLFWNKVAGAVLSAGLLAMVAGFAAHMIYNPQLPATAAYPIGGDAVATASSAAKPVAAPALAPIGPMLAAADIEAGRKVARKCVSCHTFNKGGANKIGPNLWDIVEAEQSTGADFKYSKTFKALDGRWTYDDINRFLHKPRTYAKGTKMSFAGLRKDSDRANIIVYLRSLSDSPKPLPTP